MSGSFWVRSRPLNVRLATVSATAAQTAMLGKDVYYTALYLASFPSEWKSLMSEVPGGCFNKQMVGRTTIP
jgi:hypothetical protein